MVLKCGIDQVTRKYWEWIRWDENWISANYVNPGPPDETHKIRKGSKKFNYGFYDFVVVECTPEKAYDIHGWGKQDVKMPPAHPRAGAFKTNYQDASRHFHKSKSGYKTMAYGWGKHSDVLDSNCTTNKYVDVEGPTHPSDLYGDAYVKFIPLLIPGGLAKNDTFWIDLNKGVRALYFPASYKYSKGYPQDAAYAKISFVEESSRNLIDAEGLFFGNMLSKAFANVPIDLSGITEDVAGSISLEKEYHFGAYSTDKTIIINVPKFIDACYFMHNSQAARAEPHDAIYLAKSSSIKASKLPKTDSYDHWRLPPDVYQWELHTKSLMHSYSAELNRSEQMNMQEHSVSDVSAEAELFCNIIICAASLIPVVGPMTSTFSGVMLENMKGLRTDSTEEEANAAGITNQIWNSIPGEAKDKIVPILRDFAKGMKSVKA